MSDLTSRMSLATKGRNKGLGPHTMLGRDLVQVQGVTNRREHGFTLSAGIRMATFWAHISPVRNAILGAMQRSAGDDGSSKQVLAGDAAERRQVHKLLNTSLTRGVYLWLG